VTGPIEPVYRYRASCLRVIDGDTFVAAVDLGFGPERGKPGVTLPLRIRVHGVDTPEVSKPWDKAQDGPGKAAAAFAFLSLMYAPLVIESYKDERSFERWVCDVWIGNESYADLLRQQGHAL
jgi:endonuclease YncB( thermonuclease family)